jgi:hypothetical protein
MGVDLLRERLWSRAVSTAGLTRSESCAPSEDLHPSANVVLNQCRRAHGLWMPVQSTERSAPARPDNPDKRSTPSRPRVMELSQHAFCEVAFVSMTRRCVLPGMDEGLRTHVERRDSRFGTHKCLVVDVEVAGNLIISPHFSTGRCGSRVSVLACDVAGVAAFAALEWVFFGECPGCATSCRHAVGSSCESIRPTARAVVSLVMVQARRSQTSGFRPLSAEALLQGGLR